MRRDTYLSIERHHVNSEHTCLTIISVFNPKCTQTNLNTGTNLCSGNSHSLAIGIFFGIYLSLNSSGTLVSNNKKYYIVCMPNICIHSECENITKMIPEIRRKVYKKGKH